MNLNEAFAASDLLARIAALADRVKLGGGVGTSLNNLKNPGVNRAGERLELWVKHFLAGTIGHADEETVKKIWDDRFSFHGGTNNPPDIILKNSIAVEVKKTQNASGVLQLNSSWPIRSLLRDDSHITQECRDSETWTEKPFLLFVGRVNPATNSISALWIIDGRCLADNESVYGSLLSEAQASMLNLGGERTREIGRFNAVDALQRTALRVRPMFALDHPAKIFEEIFVEQGSHQFVLNVLIPTESFACFAEKQRLDLSSPDRDLQILEIEIPDPTDREKKMKSTFISGKW